MILISIMKNSKLFLGVGLTVGGMAFVLAGCGSDSDTTFTTTSSSSSGDGGTGGSAGTGGMGTGGMGTGGMGTGGMGTGGMGTGGMGTGGLGGSGGMGATCMKPADMCASCLYDQCQLAYCDCAAEPACFGLIGCIQQCPPNMPDCVGGCYVANAQGFSEFTIASSCSGTLCAPSCPNSQPVKQCDLCLAQRCEMQLETCLAEVTCFPLIDCLTNCMGNMGCEQQCRTMYPNATPLVQSLFVCASMGCPTMCN